MNAATIRNDIHMNAAIRNDIHNLVTYLSGQAAEGNGAAHMAYVALRKIQDAVLAAEEKSPNYPSVMYPSAWKMYITGEDNIDIIREVRYISGATLAEAKNIVDGWNK